MGTMQLKNKNGVIINIDPVTVERVRALEKGAKTCFIDIGSIEIEVRGAARSVAAQISKAGGVRIDVLEISGTRPAFVPEGSADGPFDLETGLATDTAPPPEFETGNASGDIPDDEKGMMGT